MIKTILVPLDGSRLAEQILPYARTLARVFQAQLHLVQVITHIEKHSHEPIHTAWMEPNLYIDNWQREQDEQLYQHLRQNGENYLETIADELRADGLTVTTDLHFGHAANCIVQTAERHPVDLIAMATHGYSGLKRWTLGSITDKVIHMTTLPVFVVRGHETTQPVTQPPELRHILVPLDGSELSRQALPFANALANAAHADLRLLQAVPPEIDAYAALRHTHVPMALYTDIVSDQISNPEVRFEKFQKAQRSLHAAVAATACVTAPFSTQVSVGAPAEAIIEEAEAGHIDVIVMATHGYTGLQRLALGSVADKVLHASSTPLVLIRTHNKQA